MHVGIMLEKTAHLQIKYARTVGGASTAPLFSKGPNKENVGKLLNRRLM